MRKCQVCHEVCNTTQEWHNHFFQQKHFQKVTQDLQRMDEKVKACSVVVTGHSGFQGMLLNSFSKEHRTIRNFMWDPNRPRVGVIQFESRASVDSLMKEMKGSSHLWVGGERVSVTKVTDLTQDFECKENSAPVVQSSSRSCQLEPKVVLKPREPCNNLEESVKDFIPREEKVFSSFFKAVDEKVPNLSSQFGAIRLEVEIPDQEFQKLLQLLKKIQIISRNRNATANFPTLFRHNYLKLRNAGSNHLLIYLCDFECHPLPEVEKLFESSDLKPLIQKDQDLLHNVNVEHGYPYLDSKTGLQFRLVNNPDQHAEVVACQLARHLLSFDPRAKSLLTLVHFWARENKVTLSEMDDARSSLQVSKIPDPAALEWLCIFYLIKEQVIPSLKEIRDEAKEQKSVYKVGDMNSNVWFPKDAIFRRKWRAAKMKGMPLEVSNQYVLDVLKLVRGFFVFCCETNAFKGKVLKTMDGKIVDLLTAIEIGIIREDICVDIDECGDPREFQRMKMKALDLKAELGGQMYLMHPFIPSRRFEVCQKRFEHFVQPLMKKTARKLDLYLKIGQQKKDGDILEVDLKSLFQCERVEPIYGMLSKNFEMKKDKNDVEPQPIRAQDQANEEINISKAVEEEKSRPLANEKTAAIQETLEDLDEIIGLSSDAEEHCKLPENASNFDLYLDILEIDKRLKRLQSQLGEG